jgi:hypothetical protein
MGENMEAGVVIAEIHIAASAMARGRFGAPLTLGGHSIPLGERGRS